MTNEKKKIIATFPMQCKKHLVGLTEMGIDVKFEEFCLEGIRDPIAYLLSNWCLQTIGKKLKFNLGDIDGFLCNYTDFLFVEFKKSPYKMNEKQLAAYIQLAESTKGTVFLVFGENCNPNSYIRIDQSNPYGTDLIPTNLSEFQDILKSCCTSEEDEFIKLANEIIWDININEAKTLIERANKQYKEL